MEFMEKIACKRGVRQGEPLSRLLFVHATNLLQCIINKSYAQGLLTLPISSYDNA
jgi:hypothetical protein